MKNWEFIEGVAIIGKYQEKNNYGVSVEHDQLWFGSFDSVTDEKDKARLEELGWFEDEDAWSCFI